jgi:hypothetical protein
VSISYAADRAALGRAREQTRLELMEMSADEIDRLSSCSFDLAAA